MMLNDKAAVAHTTPTGVKYAYETDLTVLFNKKKSPKAPEDWGFVMKLILDKEHVLLNFFDQHPLPVCVVENRKDEGLLCFLLTKVV